MIGVAIKVAVLAPSWATIKQDFMRMINHIYNILILITESMLPYKPRQPSCLWICIRIDGLSKAVWDSC